jgi:cytochrome c biogenesis protein CcmG/thiol:disulfide interchange protein DsbE
LPGAGFAGLAVAFAWGLRRDPTEVPSSLIGKPVPAFSLPLIQGRRLGLSSTDLHGAVSLVNVFASWCVACRAEHPLLMRLVRHGLGGNQLVDPNLVYCSAYGRLTGVPGVD